MTTSERTPFTQYAGLFLVALATLMFEILLTRIFSVNMWYHFAFVAISVAMFGMTVGALIVYLRPRTFAPEHALRHMGVSALLFGIAIGFCFLTYLCIPFIDDRRTLGALLYGFTLFLIYAIVSVPFVLSGVCVCLALTRFPRAVSRLYAADLAGAAIGCVALVVVLSYTDAPTAVFVAATLALLAAACFFYAAGNRRWVWAALLLAAGCTLFCIDNTRLLAGNSSHIPMPWFKGRLRGAPLYQKWNTFSRITVSGHPEERVAPFGWGLSSKLPEDLLTRQLMLFIDSEAATPMPAFHGNLDKVRYLRYDVVNLAHYVSPKASVLVIGSGGGRDVLSAIVFGQSRVTAVEINGNTLRAANQVFGDFTGHLDRQPGVRFVHDEARSYITRTPETYDMIQISLIDTWAATAAGAFVLTENSLYTQEAWSLFLRRLKPEGLLTVSRWYFSQSPGETCRALTLARAALASLGVQDFRRHVFLARSGSVANLLVSPTPLSAERVAQLEQTCTDLEFQVLLSPSSTSKDVLGSLLAPGDIAPLLRSLPINVSAPTDDSPFFFNTLRLSHFLRAQSTQGQLASVNARAVSLLVSLLFVVILLTIGCIVLPLFLGADRSALASARPFLLFFTAIGLGFMFVEIAVMQRLNIFLGHPVYGLSVTLFSLLLASGLGSLTTGRVRVARGMGRGRMIALLALLVLYGFASELVIRQAAGFSTPARIAIAVLMIAPTGFFMGMAFPLGMKAALARAEGLAPWLWGVNGATSVCASVVAMLIALSFGIHVAFWTGVVCYALAAWALLALGLPAGRAEDRTATPA